MPAFLLAPLVGPLADRYSKKKLLIISHALSGLSSLGLAWLFMSGQFTFELGITLVAMSSAASSIQFPTFNSAIAVMVDKEDLGRASGLSQFGYGAAQLIAPPLGGVLLPIIDISGIIDVDDKTNYHSANSSSLCITSVDFMSDQSQVELRFFSGTIEIHINRTQPLHEFTWPTAVQWDPRTSCLRAPAIAYSAIVMALVRQRKSHRMPILERNDLVHQKQR